VRNICAHYGRLYNVNLVKTPMLYKQYGSDLNDLAEYNKGAYAYWLAAGISANCGEKMIEDCISLFVEENLSETSEEEEKPAA
jgi:hypothetical protein